MPWSARTARSGSPTTARRAGCARSIAAARISAAAIAERLDALREVILREIPGAGIASDQFCRVSDLAVDFCEDVPRLLPEDVERIVAAFEAAGATAKVSSIHVNGWFGEFDKLSTSRACLGELFGIDLERDNETCVFVGDSPNDQPMFAFFRHGVGVANVRDFALERPPAWVTEGRAAAGFAELAQALLEAQDEVPGRGPGRGTVNGSGSAEATAEDPADRRGGALPRPRRLGLRDRGRDPG